MFEEFWDKKKIMIQFTGAVTTIGALFLNISTPQNEAARTALANIQMFWLVIITTALTSLFVDFIFYIIRLERELSNRSLPVYGVFSAMVGATLLWLVLNLWSYILSLYTNPFVKFISMSYPAIFLIVGTLILKYIEKKQVKFFTELIITDFIVSVWLVPAFSFFVRHVGLSALFNSWIKLLAMSFVTVTAFMFCIFLWAKLSQSKKLINIVKRLWK